MLRSASGLTGPGLGHAYDHSNGTGFDPFAGTILGIAVYDVALDGDAIRNNFNSFTNDTTKQSNEGDIDGNGKVEFADFLVLSALISG